MKQGMTIQPFIFIMALVVMALVITFGAKSILDLKKTADFTELSVFVDKLDNEVEKFYNFDVGSSKKLILAVPSKAHEICFSKPGASVNVPINDAFFKSVLEGKHKSNMFVIPLGSFPKTDFYIERLSIKGDKNPLCFTTKGQIEIILETVLHDGEVSVEVRER